MPLGSSNGYECSTCGGQSSAEGPCECGLAKMRGEVWSGTKKEAPSNRVDSSHNAPDGLGPLPDNVVLVQYGNRWVRHQV